MGRHQKNGAFGKRNVGGLLRLLAVAEKSRHPGREWRTRLRQVRGLRQELRSSAAGRQTVDAIRLSQSRCVDAAESIRRTDAAMGIGRLWESGSAADIEVGAAIPSLAGKQALAAASANDQGA